MNDRSYLLKRKRSNILKQRKTRPVSCRHQYTHDYSFQKSNDLNIKEITPVQEEKVLIQETEEVVEDIHSEVQKETAVQETVPQEEPVIPEEPAEKKLTRKERKKQEKEEIINLLIDEPDIQFLNMLFNPLACMDQVSELDYATLSGGQRFIMNLFKWLAIGACFAMPIMKIVDINPYGFSRLNFTSTSMIAFAFALYGFISEGLIMFLISLLCISKKQPVERKRVVSIYTYGAPLETLLFVISTIIMYFQLPLGIACEIGSIAVAMYLKAYGISKSCLAQKRFLLGLLVLTILSTLLFFFYAEIVGSDVIKIFKNIMNL